MSFQGAQNSRVVAVRERIGLRADLDLGAGFLELLRDVIRLGLVDAELDVLAHGDPRDRHCRAVATVIAPEQARSMASIDPPTLAEVAPDFTLPDANELRRHLAELCAERPLVLVFYRGHW
jgi:hypothetical protein